MTARGASVGELNPVHVCVFVCVDFACYPHVTWLHCCSPRTCGLFGISEPSVLTCVCALCWTGIRSMMHPYLGVCVSRDVIQARRDSVPRTWVRMAEHRAAMSLVSRISCWTMDGLIKMII